VGKSNNQNREHNSAAVSSFIDGFSEVMAQKKTVVK